MGVGSIVAKTAAPQTLKQAIKNDLKSSRVQLPLTSESWLRASALADVCPREEVIAARLQIKRTDSVSADLGMIFAHGHGLHWTMQNHVLAEGGVLVGKWRCLNCAATYGGVDYANRKPSTEEYVPRPTRCSNCGMDMEAQHRDGITDAPPGFQYVEQLFYDSKYRVSGHPDGFLCLRGLPGIGVLEIKSASAKTAWEVKGAPLLSHVVQSHIYMWFTGAQWAKIVYWEKGMNGVGALTEHHVDRDEETIANIKRLVESIWNGLRGGSLPPRICATKDDAAAKECAACGPCFADASLPTDQEWGF